MKLASVSLVFGVMFYSLALLFQGATAQTLHVVGDSLGWDVPSNGAAAYESWASNNKFMVGDILMFNFTTNSHDVLQVPEESYDSCSSANPIGDIITTGPANISLTTTGDHYYICTIGRHCLGGQKLAITVTGSPGASPPTSTPSPSHPPPASNNPTSSPPPSSNTPHDGCPPPASSPSPPTATPPPPNSSATHGFATSFLVLLSILVCLVF